MRLEPETTVPPAIEPLSVEEAQLQCQLDEDEGLLLLPAYIRAARRRLERRTGSRLITQTVKLRRPGFYDLGDDGKARCSAEPGWLQLEVAPVQSVVVAYLDPTGAEQTLDTSIYESFLWGLSPKLHLAGGKSWPSTKCAPDAVRITAVAGYGGAPNSIPDDILHAMKLLVAHWYRNREPMIQGEVATPLPDMIDGLLGDYRVFGF